MLVNTVVNSDLCHAVFSTMGYLRGLQFLKIFSCLFQVTSTILFNFVGRSKIRPNGSRPKVKRSLELFAA